jgi:beta-N-acetylhexosaminidase
VGSDVLHATKVTTAVGYMVSRPSCALAASTISFTPVLDLNYGGSQQVIGDRAAFTAIRAWSTILAKSVMHGLALAGMRNCGKHFPGHGFVKADSHVEIPVDKRGLKTILADDARPYDWLAGTLTAVMPAHVIYPKVDKRPAGFSAKWLQDILRQRLGFDGVIFSDDLSMEAGRYIDGTLLSYADAALAAIEAGCDLALLCNQSIGDGAPLDALLKDFGAARDAGRWGAMRQRGAPQALLPRSPATPWSSLANSTLYQGARRLSHPSRSGLEE